MKHVWVAALVVAVLSIAIMPAGAAAADGASTARVKAPAWMTKTIRARISKAGAKGVSMTKIRRWVRGGAAGRRAKEEPVADPCPGASPSDKLQSNTCITYPAGCTANFIYHYGPGPVGDTSDGRNYYIGTAGHCVDHANQHVFMQVGAAMVDVGTVFKLFHGDIGNDFTAIRIRQGIRVEPRTPIGGPNGIYTGCDPSDVEYWGHGYEFAVGPGKTEGGLALDWFDRSFGWAGPAFGGDSGSGVIVGSSGEAAGILTHLVVDPARYPASITAGTRVTRALTFLGANFYLVNEDYSTSRADMSDTSCGNSDAGGA
jgi:hypothetical protein